MDCVESISAVLQWVICKVFTWSHFIDSNGTWVPENCDQVILILVTQVFQS